MEQEVTNILATILSELRLLRSEVAQLRAQAADSKVSCDPRDRESATRLYPVMLDAMREETFTVASLFARVKRTQNLPLAEVIDDIAAGKDPGKVLGNLFARLEDVPIVGMTIRRSSPRDASGAALWRLYKSD
jgi:hypothetical protein